MDAQKLRQRGDAVDELQRRMTQIVAKGRTVPEEWRTKLKQLADATDVKTVDDIANWIAVELPPQEYMTEEVTWQTFDHFASALLDRLTMYVMRLQLINGSAPDEAVEIMKEIAAIPNAIQSPILAMSELSKLRTRALTELQDFTEAS